MYGIAHGLELQDYTSRWARRLRLHRKEIVGKVYHEVDIDSNQTHNTTVTRERTQTNRVVQGHNLQSCTLVTDPQSMEYDCDDRGQIEEGADPV